MNGAARQEREKGKIILGVTENVCIELSKFKGNVRVDLRKWFQPTGTNENVRTKNGLNVSKDEWDAIIEQIGKIDLFVQENYDNANQLD